MELKEYFRMIWKSLNPNKHRELVQVPFFDLVKYLCFVVLLGVLFSLLVMVPMLSSYQGSLKSEVSAFQDFRVDVNASLDERITLLERPKIAVDFGKENMTDEFVLINEDAVHYKKFIFFGEETAAFSDYQSVKSEQSTDLFSSVLIFLFPAILFWVTVLFLIKEAFLILLFGTLGWVFFISGKNEVTFQKSLKTAVFTATPMILLDLMLWPIAIMYVIPLAVYVAYFLIGLIMVSDRRYGNKG